MTSSASSDRPTPDGATADGAAPDGAASDGVTSEVAVLGRPAGRGFVRPGSFRRAAFCARSFCCGSRGRAPLGRGFRGAPSLRGAFGRRCFGTDPSGRLSLGAADSGRVTFCLVSRRAASSGRVPSGASSWGRVTCGRASFRAASSGLITWGHLSWGAASSACASLDAHASARFSICWVTVIWLTGHLRRRGTRRRRWLG